MVDLVLDFGNTSVKWGAAPHLTEEGFAGEVAYAHASGAEALAQALRHAWPLTRAPGAIGYVGVRCSSLESQVTARLGGYWDVPVSRLESRAAEAGVVNGYDRPEELGSDRWAALIAARRQAPGGACVVDVGTAITVDGLDDEGLHVGGAIFPGPGLLRRILAEGASGLPHVSDEAGGHLPARATSEAIQSGVAVGELAALEALVDKVGKACPPAVPRLITGGGALGVIAGSDRDWLFCPRLVLQGVARWLRIANE